MVSACISNPAKHTTDNTQNSDSLALFDKPSKSTNVSATELQNRAIQYYQEYLEISGNAAERAEAMRRLADLDLEKTENLINLDPEAGASPHHAIKYYEELIKNHPEYEHLDSVFYQLARAYDLSGELIKSLQTLLMLIEKKPDSRYIAEAYFRLGDTLFTLGRYQEAAHAYQKIIQLGETSLFYEKALYKHGWSEFKCGQYTSAQKSFIKLLDIILFDTDTSLLWSVAALERDSDKKLINDIFQVLGSSFYYQNGATSIDRFFRQNGRRDYEYNIYSIVGDIYQKRGQPLKAAQTYDAFIKQSPYNIHTPRFSAKKITIYRQAGLSDKLLSAKTDFVTRYDINSDYWNDRNQSARHQIMSDLKTNTEELAQHYHALAQRTKNPKAFRQAAHWYQVFIRNFPNDKKTPSVNFMLAELLFENRDYANAIKEYEKTAYDYPRHENSAAAGYAALIAHQYYQNSLGYQQKQQWKSKAALSALRFTETFPKAPQTAQVTIRATEQLYASGEYETAINSAKKILESDISLEPEVKITALTVIAHSQFDLKDYAAAENSYKEILKQLPATELHRYQKLTEKLAAAIYKQGEIQHDQQKYRNAIRHYSRIAKTAPAATNIIATAAFDSAACYIALKNWKKAIDILESFRHDYPGHPLQKDVTNKLAIAYMESGATLKAAEEFNTITQSGGEVSPEALWLTADLFQKNGKIQEAITIYERYITLYPEPFEQAIEAYNRIATLYSNGKNPAAYNRWLNKIIKADKNAGDKRTERTRYLAAQAALILARSSIAPYRKVKLVEPLKDNLRKKKRYMQNSLKAYTQVIDYSIAETTAAATYSIADIYYDFSRALLESERPSQLNSEELEQYDILLEEQAFPFEEKAIETHIKNTHLTRNGIYNQWIEKSFKELRNLMPARYKKPEQNEIFINKIH